MIKMVNNVPTCTCCNERELYCVCGLPSVDDFLGSEVQVVETPTVFCFAGRKPHSLKIVSESGETVEFDSHDALVAAAKRGMAPPMMVVPLGTSVVYTDSGRANELADECQRLRDDLTRVTAERDRYELALRRTKR